MANEVPKSMQLLADKLAVLEQIRALIATLPRERKPRVVKKAPKRSTQPAPVNSGADAE